MLDRWFRTACCAALLLAAPLLPAAADDDSFTVANIHEDVTAASALAAKDQAQAEGQQKAFDELMTRISPGRTPPRLSPEQLTDLVAAFEIANERTSTVRYVADYTFHFNPAGIRRLMQDGSIAAAATPAAPAAARPYVVLPVYDASDHAVLWDDPNPWRDAWAAHTGVPGPLSITVPVGDLPDVSAIDAPKAEAADPVGLKAISARYRDDDVLVVTAKMHDAPRRLDTTVTRYSPDSPGAPQSMLVMTSAKPDETDTSLMDRAVFNVVAQVAHAWRAAADPVNPAGPNAGGGTLDAMVQSGSLADWVAVRNRLREIPTVRAADMVSFDRNQIRVAIRYVGDEGQLRAALRQRNLDLTGSDPDWTLVIQTAAPAPAPAKPDSDAVKPGALRKADGQP